MAPAKTTTKPIAAKSSTGAYSDTARALTSMAWMKKSGVTSPPFNPGSDVTTVNTLFSFQFYGCAPPSRKADTPKRTNDRDGVRRRIGRAKTEVVTVVMLDAVPMVGNSWCQIPHAVVVQCPMTAVRRHSSSPVYDSRPALSTSSAKTAPAIGVPNTALTPAAVPACSSTTYSDGRTALQPVSERRKIR